MKDEQKKKTTSTKNPSMEQTTPGSELEQKKKILHNLIDSLTPADYVSLTSSVENLTAKNTQKLYRIIIEVNGNIIVQPKIHPFFKEDDEDEF